MGLLYQTLKAEEWNGINLIMNDVILGFNYAESSIPIQNGDRIRIDDRNGRVKKICFPGTQDARDYSCEKEGGILIEYDDGILALERIGHYHIISKIDVL